MLFRKSFLLGWILVLTVNFLYAETLPTVLRENFKVTLSASQQGPIILYVDFGDQVAKGDKLFGWESNELALKVKLASLQWEQAKASESKAKNKRTADEIKKSKLQFEQQEALYSSGGISPDAYEIAKVEYKLAIQDSRAEDIIIAESNVNVKQHQLRLAEIELEKATSIAHADARVHQVLVQPNEFVRAGQEVLILLNINPLHVLINIPLDRISKVKLNSSMDLQVLTGGNNTIKIKGVIKHISDEVDAVSQTVSVRLEIDNKEKLFKPGMRAQVVLP